MVQVSRFCRDLISISLSAVTLLTLSACSNTVPTIDFLRKKPSAEGGPSSTENPLNVQVQLGKVKGTSDDNFYKVELAATNLSQARQGALDGSYTISPAGVRHE